MSSFYVIEGPDRGRRFELLPNRVETIGREEGATVQLHDTEVSRKHARIIYDSGRYLITDLNSSNGTYVNQVRITTAAINSGDKVNVGSTCLQFTQTPNIEQDDSGASSISFELPSDDHSQIVQTMRHTEEGRPFSVQDCQSFLSSSLDKTEQAESYLRLVYETATALKSTGSIDDLMEKILDLIFQWINPDRGCIILSEPHTHELQVRCYRVREQGVSEKMTISRTILDYVTNKNEGVLSRNAMNDARFDASASIVHQKVSEAICVPLDGRYGCVGVIYIDTEANDALNPERNSAQGRTAHFDENHLKMMVAIAHHAAIAIEDIRFYSAMIQSERLAAIGQTVANLSHHIKNILQGVSGGSYLIESGLKNHDEKLISKGWGIVERNQGKISSLVMDMLTFSKERSAEPELDNMNDALDEVVELMKPRAEEFHVALTWVRNEQFPEFYFDRNLINRAVLNLITNAIDAAADNVSQLVAEAQGDQSALNNIPQGAVSVTLGWGEIPTNVRISVFDNGAGVPANQVEQIFTPFVSTKGSKGTGLGLPVVKKVVTEHGGTVTCVPLEKGGTAFHIDLPFRKDPDTDGTEEDE
ncbi:MAG: FHA domain-containing protein [Thermoguttaceae bacterium]|nr:FHA domain-containing protein [Thermoguttaceae bacterium]